MDGKCIFKFVVQSGELWSQILFIHMIFPVMTSCSVL